MAYIITAEGTKKEIDRVRILHPTSIAFGGAAHDIIAFDSSGALITPAVGTNAIPARVGSADIASLGFGTNTVFLRAGGNIEAFFIPLQSMLLRRGTGANLGFITFPTQSLLLRAAGDILAVSMGTNTMVLRAAGNISFQAIATNELILRGSGNLASTPIPDGNFTGRPVGGSLGAVTGLQAHAILQGLGVLTLVTQTANYTALSTDEVILCDATSGSFTITLPAVSGTSGKRYYIKKLDSSANTVTIDGNASETIDDGLTAILTDQYESITIVSDGTEWFII